jgi:hypothetical protein
MPRYRGTDESSPSLVGRLLLLLTSGEETSATLAGKLGVSPRQVNRYVRELNRAGWHIERRGAKRQGNCRLTLIRPRIITSGSERRSEEATS